MFDSKTLQAALTCYINSVIIADLQDIIYISKSVIDFLQGLIVILWV